MLKLIKLQFSFMKQRKEQTKQALGTRLPTVASNNFSGPDFAIVLQLKGKDTM